MDIRWESFLNSYPESSSQGSGGKSGEYVREFAAVVSRFHDRTDSLIATYSEITTTIEALATCPYDAATLASHLQSIQKIIDQLNLEAYANLDAWVSEIDAKIEAVFLVRLRSVLDLWCSEFSKDGEVVRVGSRKKDVSLSKVSSAICCVDQH